MIATVPFLGSKFVRNLVVSDLISDAERVSTGVKGLETRFPHIDSNKSTTNASVSERPIFVLSAGWGSGSTLVQRLIISSKDALIWGEPLDISATVHRMSNTLIPFRPEWPPQEHFLPERAADKLSREWIANLVPPIEDLKSSHRLFFSNWLGKNALESGYSRWGLKEVRLTIDHARYLKWLYPEAKFVFVYRDLFRCYNSCRRRRDWYSVWPKYKATPIVAFAHHWTHLVSGFLDGFEEVGGMLLRYEDLIADGYGLEALKEYLDLENIDEELLKKNVGARSKYRSPLIYPEKVILQSIGGKMRRELKYT